MDKMKIDAVAMTRRIRDAHYEQLKDASPEERIAFYREKARLARQQLEREAPTAPQTFGRGSLEGRSTDFERDPDRF